ncbi:hypothetical protein ACRAWF_39655 [Streptomyces sp. L7]
MSGGDRSFRAAAPPASHGRTTRRGRSAGRRLFSASARRASLKPTPLKQASPHRVVSIPRPARRSLARPRRSSWFTPMTVPHFASPSSVTDGLLAPDPGSTTATSISICRRAFGSATTPLPTSPSDVLSRDLPGPSTYSRHTASKCGPATCAAKRSADCPQTSAACPLSSRAHAGRMTAS